MAAVAAPGRGDDTFRNDFDVGLDVFYSLTPRLRANFTVNTDFAQTEVDQRQVNLTRFSLFFPEKRDFFLEGAAFFDFGTNRQTRFGSFSRAADNSLVPFFTRRIGLKTDGTPQTIAFGTKVTGRAGVHDIGVLHVRTEGESDVLGEDFTVMRVKRNLLAQSYIGAMYTRRAPRVGRCRRPTYGGSGRPLGDGAVPRDRRTSRWERFISTRPTWRDTGDSAAFGASIDYPNDRYGAGFSFREVQQDYNPALGFTLRQNFRRYNPFVRFAPRPREHPWILQWATMLDANLQTDPRDNRWLTRELDITLAQISFHSQDSIEFHVRPTYERLRTALCSQSGDHPSSRQRVRFRPLSVQGADRESPRHRPGHDRRGRRLLLRHTAPGHAQLGHPAADGNGLLPRHRVEPDRTAGRLLQHAALPFRSRQPIQPVAGDDQQRPVRLGQRRARLAGTVSLDYAAR